MSRKRLVLIIAAFIAIGLASEILLWHVQKSDIFLAVMAPVLTGVYFIENLLPVLKTLSAVQNEYSLIIPITLIYFGLIGYWVVQILREDGFFKYLALLCIAGFLGVIHWQALTFLQSILSH